MIGIGKSEIATKDHPLVGYNTTIDHDSITYIRNNERDGRMTYKKWSYQMANATMINAHAVNNCANWIGLVGGQLDGEAVYVYRVGNIVAVNYEGDVAFVDGTEVAASEALAPYISAVVAIAQLPEEYVTQGYR